MEIRQKGPKGYLVRRRQTIEYVDSMKGKKGLQSGPSWTFKGQEVGIFDWPDDWKQANELTCDDLVMDFEAKINPVI